MTGVVNLKGLNGGTAKLQGDLSAFSFWYPEISAGNFQGTLALMDGKLSGQASIEGGRGSIAAFPVQGVAGTVEIRNELLTTKLKGRSLNGPVTAEGRVDFKASHYRFEVHGTPRIKAFTTLMGLDLPVSGSGPLDLKGWGWTKLELAGEYQGSGLILGQPFSYNGTLAYKDNLRVQAGLQSNFFDRRVHALFKLDKGYTLHVTDDLGSNLSLWGRGADTHGSGLLAWPRPLDGSARVSWQSRGSRYTVKVDSENVRLPLAKPLNLSGQVQGEGDTVNGQLGPLALSGRWTALRLKLSPLAMLVGTVQGQGLYKGRLSADLSFDSPYARLPVQVSQEGATWRLYAGAYGAAAYVGGIFTAKLTDLPVQLGEASGSRYTVKVDSENVRLPLAKPLNLSGQVQGEGDTVNGQLGPLALSGRWTALRLKLSPLAMLVGTVQGQGLYKGRLSADLSFDSPYARLPVQVSQEGATWRLYAGAYGAAAYVGGIFTAKLTDLPVQLGEAMRLSGTASYQSGWRGQYTLKSSHLDLNGQLAGLTTQFSGHLSTPLGVLPLSGHADASGIRAKLADLVVSVSSAGGLSAKGRLHAGFLSIAADMSYRGRRFSGTASVVTPWVSARLRGDGTQLLADTSGYAVLSGQVWPQPALSGHLNLPAVPALKLPPIPLRLSRKGLELPGVGSLAFTPDLPLSLELPFTYAGQAMRLRVSADRSRLKADLELPQGALSLVGPWNAVVLDGGVKFPRVGLVKLSGRINVPALEYTLRAEPTLPPGSFVLQGRGTDWRLSGSLQSGGRLSVQAGPAVQTLQADHFNLGVLGLPVVLNGTLRNAEVLQAALTAKSPYGTLRASGYGRAVHLDLWGPDYSGEGYASLKGLQLSTRLLVPRITGTLELTGPWDALILRGGGEAKLPYLKPQAWSLEGKVSTQSWRLSGPLTLDGQGLAYLGTVRWPYAFLGRQGVLEGRLKGRGTDLDAALQTIYAGLALRLHTTYGTGGLHAELITPGGGLDYQDGWLSTAGLQLSPLAKPFDLNISGRLAGSLSLDGKQGSLSGPLQIYGQTLSLNLEGQRLAIKWAADA